MSQEPSSSLLKKASSRKWLGIGLSVTLGVIGVALLYRSMTGQTIKEQRVQSAREKEAKELAAKPPGNGDSFSAKLSEKLRTAVEEQEKEAAKAAASTPPTPPTPTGSSDKSPSAPRSPSGAAPARTATGNESNPQGRMPDGTPNDDQVDRYEALKAQEAKNQNRKLGVWEANSGAQSISGGASGNVGSLSGFMGQLGTGQPAPQSTSSASPSSALIDQYARSQQQGNGAAQFLKTSSKTSVDEPLRVQAGPGRFSVLEGTAIELVMRSKVSSDLPGPCRAQVSQDVFDTVTGTVRLIPAGATVICTYSNEVQPGQERLLLAFTRLTFPATGASIALGAMQAGDEQGAIGTPAQVNSRFWQIFGSSFAVAALTKLAENRNQQTGVTINVTGALTGTAAQVLADVAKKALERNMSVKPELSLAPGDAIRMIVTRDMVLDPNLTGVR